MRLDKTVFQEQSFTEASDHQRIYKKMSDKEKARSFHHLVSVAYGFVNQDWPRMDKTHFEIRKHQ